MSDAHANQMMYLLAFVGFLFFVIIGVVALSQLNKNKKKNQFKDLDSLPADKTLPSEGVHQILKTVEEKAQFDLKKKIEVEVELKNALKKTEENFFGRIKKAFTQDDKKKVIEEIEEVLYTSDLGPVTVQKLLEVIQNELSSKDFKDIEAVKKALKNEMLQILNPFHLNDQKIKKVSQLIKKSTSGPTVLLIVGVNGAGKTTSIGKISAQLAAQNFKVLVAAGDTFRAAAGGQLKTWTDRAQNANQESEGSVEIYWPENATDPSGVSFDALTKAKAQNFDYVILDTAGRLHTQSHLMDELKKVKRVMTKVIPEAPHETWIVLDANSGQNALLQAKEFNQALQLTGVVLTKMDGTAKGGVALGVVDQIQIPIKLIGLGEKIIDLKSFDQNEYVDSILGYE